jgi:tetratricopeptide (TPR) repeat protein
MKSFLKLLNQQLFTMIGLLIGLLAIAVIAIYVRVGVPVKEDGAAAVRLARTGDFIAAGERLSRSADAGVLRADRYQEAGVVFLLGGAPGPAEDAYRAALAAGASRDECLIGIARAAAMAKRDPIDHYRRAMVAMPGDPWPSAEAAIYLAATGRRDEAMALLEEAERLRWVADPSIEAARALILLAAGDRNGARAAIEGGASIAVAGSRGAGEFHRAAALVAAGDVHDSAARNHVEAARAELIGREDALRLMVLPPAAYAIWSGPTALYRPFMSGIEPISRREDAVKRLFPEERSAS